MTINELILKLPEEYREIAQRYTTLLVGMSFEELQAWVGLLASGNWKNAYTNLIAKLPTDEILIEEQKGHEILKRLNKDNAEQMSLQFALIEQIFLTSLLMLREEIEG